TPAPGLASTRTNGRSAPSISGRRTRIRSSSACSVDWKRSKSCQRKRGSSLPHPILTAVTLGVDDVPASARFYEALGFKRKVRATGDDIAFFDGGGVVFAVW